MLYKILSSGCGRSQGICIFDFTGSAKLGSKLVTPVFKAVEQRQGHVRSSSESFLSVGLVEKWRTLLPGPFPLSITVVPKGEEKEGHYLPVTACDFPWRVLWEEEVGFMCSGVGGELREYQWELFSECLLHDRHSCSISLFLTFLIKQYDTHSK